MRSRVLAGLAVPVVLSALVALVAVGCTGSDPGASSPTTGGSGEHTVSVEGGFGSRTARVGETVYVWSAVSTSDEVANRWEGDANLLAEPGEWRTSFVMPDRDVELVATSDPQPLVLDLETFTGATTVPKDVRYHFPPDMRGVVLFSHGTGGNSRFIEGDEAFPLALALVADGYGVISTEAEESAAGDLNGNGKERWDTRAVPGNVDLRNLEILFDDFESRGLLGGAVPKFALGMSAGGSFSHFLGTVAATALAPEFPQLRFVAVVGYCADGTASRAAALSTTPTAWFMCSGEDNPDVSNVEARANESRLRGRGVPTEYLENPASPLYDERFTRIDGIDAATSTAMAAELRSAGYVDASGFLVVDGDEIMVAVRDDPSRFPTISAQPEVGAVRSQLKVMRAEHSMYADATRRNVEFFDRFNPNPGS
jgi:hypothetical protein